MEFWLMGKWHESEVFYNNGDTNTESLIQIKKKITAPLQAL